MLILSLRRQRLRLLASLGLVFVLACRAADPWLSPVAPPTPTPQVLADCFWSAQAFAWVDANSNGLRDEGEPPLAGVEVNFSLTFYSGAATGLDGFAGVSGMHPGPCDPALENSLVAQAPTGYAPTTALSVPYPQDRDIYTFGFTPSP